MGETQLQIVINAVNNASEGLASVQDSLSELSTGASEAASSITESFSTAEQAAINQAQAMADAWGTATESIDADLEEIVPTTDELIQALVETNQQAAAQVAAAWAASGEVIEAGLDAALSAPFKTLKQLEEEAAAAVTEIDASMTEIDASATAGAEKAGADAAEGFGGYFKKMIVGYALDQIGSFLSGGIDSAIEGASKSKDQIATITAQIDQQKASIATNDAALMHWVGTTQGVAAAHEKAAANIEAAKVKISELTDQLATLQTQQTGIPGQITDIENAMLGWIGGNKQLEGSLQTFMTTLGPILEAVGSILIAVTLAKVAFSALGTPLLILIGIGVAVALLTSIWQAFHSQITSFLEDLNAKTGIVDLFKQSWESISNTFNENLKPALEQLWTALQPLEPYLKALGVVIGATLLGAIILLTDALTVVVNIFTDILTVGTKVATFFTNVLVGALNLVKTAVEAISTAVSKVGSVGGAIGGVISTALTSITHVQDAIITPGGGVIQTDPADYLIATKTPGALAGGGGSIVININGGYYLDQNAARQIGDALASSIGRQLKLKNFT